MLLYIHDNLIGISVYWNVFNLIGTTWISEIVWLIKNQCNTSKANAVKQDERVPYLEINPGKVNHNLIILPLRHNTLVSKCFVYKRFQHYLENLLGKSLTIKAGWRQSFISKMLFA